MTTTITTIPLPRGFRAAGVHCGIKTDASKLDLALFATDSPAAAAAVFTQNKVCGAPVVVSRSRVPRATARAVVINSGNANACTGPRGLDDAAWMTAQVAGRLGCAPDDVLVCSTGVIGRFLPREKLALGIPAVVERLAATPAGLAEAATAIMTTDTFAKFATREQALAGAPVRVSGVAKGAAMIGPNMATMLSVILTDAPLSPAEADALLRHAVDRSFNCISVEGHTSTSDTVILLSSGGRPAADLNDGDRERMQTMVNEVCAELAQAIIRDAEGASHFITIDVTGCRSRSDARQIAKSIAESALVKTAITGADPNWGRIVSAAGYSGVALAERDMTLRLNGMLLYKDGAPVDFDAAAVSRAIRSNRDVQMELSLTLGSESIRFWTSDLTAEYIRLNADYTT